MAENERTVTMHGTPVELTGNPVTTGDKAPDFEAAGNDLSPVRLSDFAGRVVVLLSVPSLDTSVCDQETRRFNKEAADLGKDVVVLVVSMDLPFAQQRWCGGNGIDRVLAVSDYKTAEFGKAYGVLMDDARLLARAVWVLDGDGVVQYHELVPEIADEPDYEAALATARKLQEK